MRLNRRGEILAGVGRAWLTDDLSVQQIGSDASGWKTIASNGEVIDEQGFNSVCAGGGKWATYLDHRGPKGNFGPLDSAGIVLDIGPDGTVAWCPNYQAGMRVQGSVALSTRVCGPDHIVYALADGRVYSTQLGFATIPAGVVPFKASVVGELLLYHTHEHLVLQRYREPRGLVIAEKPAYSPDMVPLAGGYKVAWCLNEGETVTTNRIIFDTDLTTDLSGLRDFPIVQPPPKVPPMPTRPDRFWYGPNIASVDLVRCFDDPSGLADVGVFSLYVQHLLDNGGTGPNTYAALTANHCFQKLKAAGIPLSIEMGTVASDLAAVKKVIDAGGAMPIVSMNEPLTDAKIHHPTTVEKKRAEVVAFTNQARALGVKQIVWIEAWPEIPFDQQKYFLSALMLDGAKPDGWHLDIDWHRATRDKQSPADFIKAAQAEAAKYGIPVGVFLVGYPHPTDEEYAAEVKTLATNLKAMAPNVAHVIVQSWATRGTGKAGEKQDIPLNLGPNGLLASLSQVRQIFGAPVPPVDTIPVPPPKELTKMIAYSAPVAGFLAGELAPHPDGGGAVIVVKPSGRILTVTPDGGLEDRPRDSAGAWEKFRQTGNALLAERDGGKVFVLPLVG